MSSNTPEPKTEDDAQAIKRFLQAGAHVEIKVVEAVKAQAGAQATMERPGSVTLPTTIDHLVAAADASPSRRLTIEFEFTGVTATEPFSAAVFVNKVDASVQTSHEDPAFAGAVGFFMHSHEQGGPMVMPDSLLYEFDITTLVKRIPKTATSVA